jgi:hypothetical protein
MVHCMRDENSTVRLGRTAAKAGVPLLETLEGRRMLSGALGYAFTFGQAKAPSAGNAVATDEAGNTYVAGTFHGRIDVAPTRNAKRFLKSLDDGDDIFLAKYGPRGKLLWARQFGGEGNDAATAMKLGPTGDLYLVGAFEHTASFGHKTLRSHGHKDAFIARINPKGWVLWAGHIGGRKDDSYTALDVGPDGDIYLAGTIRLQGDVDPTGNTRMITARGVDDTFVQRLDGRTGRLKWIRVYGENDTREGANALAVDPQGGGVAVAGAFNRTVQFDRDNRSFDRSAVNYDDIYLGHLDSDGNWDWLHRVGGKHDDSVAALVRGPQGDLYMTGAIASTVDFDVGPGATTLTAVGDTDAYVVRMRPDAELVWARRFGGVGAGTRARALAVDDHGNLYTTGTFYGTIVLGRRSQKVILSVDKSHNTTPVWGDTNVTDAYIAKLNAAGQLVYARRIGGPYGSIAAYGISADGAGNAHLTGAFTGTVDLDPGPKVVKHHALTDDARETDVYVLKLRAG